MNKLAIYCPTYKRSKALQAVADNIAATTKTPYTLYFGLEPEDTETIEAARATGAQVIINAGNPGYSDTLQTMYEQSDEPFFFPANDDFTFLSGWELGALGMLEEQSDLMVVGLSDGNPSTNYSTINIVRRSYIETASGVIDMPNRVLYPYHHNFSDTEFHATAIKRNVWDKWEGPAIIHEHPGFAAMRGKTPWTDETYDKNNATAPRDAEIFTSRKHLFL